MPNGLHLQHCDGKDALPDLLKRVTPLAAPGRQAPQPNTQRTSKAASLARRSSKNKDTKDAGQPSRQASSAAEALDIAQPTDSKLATASPAPSARKRPAVSFLEQYGPETLSALATHMRACLTSHMRAEAEGAEPVYHAEFELELPLCMNRAKPVADQHHASMQEFLREQDNVGLHGSDQQKAEPSEHTNGTAPAIELGMSQTIEADVPAGHGQAYDTRVSRSVAQAQT